MQGTREYLLELDKKRLAMEKQIFDLTDFLNSNGMPGVTGSLIDREGFPIPNVDLFAVRTARNKLIYLQNDLKDLMLSIETAMQDYFKNEKEKKIHIQKEPENRQEPIKIGVPSEEPNKFNNLNTSNLKVPFAFVGIVSEGSPAEEAGLKAKDGIINFDNKIFYGYYQNPLKNVSDIVKNNINQEIPIEVLRSSLDEKGFEKIEYVKLNLIPHEWEGQGVLGCKLNLEKN